MADNTERCVSCEAAATHRLARPIVDALLAAGIHLGNTTGVYKVTPTEVDGIYTLSFTVAAEFSEDVSRHHMEATR